MRLTLTGEEIFEITGYKQPKKQRLHFERLGVPAIIRPDNTLSVAREHYQQLQRGVARAAPSPQVRTVRKPSTDAPLGGEK